MASSTIVDTDIIIDVGRGIPEAVNCLQRLQSSSRLAISVVTQMELIVGCTNKSELRTLEKFLQQFDVIRIDQPISDKAVDLLRLYRLSHGQESTRLPIYSKFKCITLPLAKSLTRPLCRKSSVEGVNRASSSVSEVKKGELVLERG